MRTTNLVGLHSFLFKGKLGHETDTYFLYFTIPNTLLDPLTSVLRTAVQNLMPLHAVYLT